MPEMTLQEGDFGNNVTASFGASALYLPDPKQPGMKVMIPLADVAEIDSHQVDGLRPVKDALAMGAMTILGGGPRAMANAFSSATKVRDVVFDVVLKDGRKFVAVAGAKAFTDLRSAHLEVRAEARMASFGEVAPSPADDIIARYINTADAPPVEPPARDAAPPPPDPAPALAPAVEPEAPAMPERRVFGRRRTD